MATIALIWELGDGLGHLGRLRPLADALAARGHDCVVVSRKASDAARRVIGAYPHVPAPIEPVEGAVLGGGSVASHGDILATLGYAEPERLGAVLARWDEVFAQIRPDLVIADYAPTATLAVWGRLPVVAVGDWFTLPPRTLAELPPLRQGGPRVPDDRIMATIRAVQADRRAPAPPFLAALAGPDGAFVLTVPELDRHAKHRESPAIGPLEPLPEPVADVPPRLDYFAYLSATYPGTSRVLAALCRSGLTGRVFIRDTNDKGRRLWGERGLTILDRPAHMPTVAAESAMIIHHGGLGTLQTVMALGRPQVLIPRHLEQMWNGTMISGLGLGGYIRRSKDQEPARIAGALVRFRGQPRWAAVAARFARELAVRKAAWPGAAAVADRVDALLAERAQGLSPDGRNNPRRDD